jgi:hypothetical protein
MLLLDNFLAAGYIDCPYFKNAGFDFASNINQANHLIAAKRRR